MSSYFERYQQGFYQEVYNDLLAMQDQVFEAPVYEDALRVAPAIMDRVRSNIELLIPRLRTLGYQFVDGDWVTYWEKKHKKSSLTSEQQAQEDELFRVVRDPPPETTTLLDQAEQLVSS